MPQLEVAHHGHVDDGLVLVAEVVLAQHAQPGILGDARVTLCGVEFAREDVQERRLPRAVRAHQPVAFSPVQLERHAREERSVPEGLAEVRNGDHGGESKGIPPGWLFWPPSHILTIITIWRPLKLEMNGHE